MKSVNVVTLGCAKNIVDSEHLMGRIAAQGFDVVFESDAPSDIVIINTCGFILDAKQESIETILSFAEAKKRGDISQIYVMGCLSQRYRDELTAEMPEIDGFFGVNDISSVIEAVGADSRKSLVGERKLTTPSHYAYLKISEGCDRGCGYCAIPLIRGRHRSVPMEELLEEAEILAKGGVKELIIIAQDTTYYGLDLYGRRRLGELLRGLCRIDALEWIRLHYAYPASFPEDVIEAMRDEPKICKYLDIPFQHISDNILSAMRRGHNRVQAMELIRKLRAEIPDIALRTTLLVGYPGETAQDFDELMRFVEEVKFNRLGVFPYSEEEGTYSALNLTDDVPQEVKERRAERIMEAQMDISLAHNTALVGTLQRVIIDRRENDRWIGRTQYDSPEVDQDVHVSSPGPLQPGQMINVRITGAGDYEIFGEVSE